MCLVWFPANFRRKSNRTKKLTAKNQFAVFHSLGKCTYLAVLQRSMYKFVF